MTRIPLSDFLGGGAAVAPAPQRMKLEDFLSGGSGAQAAVMEPPQPISVPFANQPTQTDPLTELLSGGPADPDWMMAPPTAPPVQGIPSVQGVLDNYNLSGYVDPDLKNPPSFELPKSALTPPGIRQFNERKQAEERRRAEEERAAMEAAFAPGEPADAEGQYAKMQRRAKYYETLPYKITADIQSDPETFEKYRRLNELATGGPLLDVPAENRAAAQEAINATIADMKANGIDDPVRYLMEGESFDGPQGIAGRNLSAAWEQTKRSGANMFDAMVDPMGNDTLGTRQRQMEAGWQEGVEDVKDERSLLPNAVNEVARAASQSAPQLAAAAGVGYATKNPALAWATLLGPSGVENFQVGRTNGLSNAEAAGRAVALAGVEYATAKVGGKVAEKFGMRTFEELAFGTGAKAAATGTLKPITRAIGGSVIEGGEEVAAGVAQQFSDFVVGLEDELVGDETPEQLALAFAVGMVASGAMHLPTFANFVQNPTAENAEAAGITEEIAPTQVDRESLATAAAAKIETLTTADPVVEDAEFEMQPDTAPVAPEPIQAEITAPPRKRRLGERPLPEVIAEQDQRLADEVATPRKRRLGERITAPTVEPTSSLQNTASWVVKNRETGEIQFETFNPAVVDKLNKNKYEAVPILEHLQSLNAPTPPVAPPDAPPVAPSRAPADSGVGLEGVAPPVVDPPKKLGRKKAVPTEETLPDWVTESDAPNAPSLDNKQKTKLNQLHRRFTNRIDKETHDQLRALPDRDQHAVSIEAERRADTANEFVRQVIDDFNQLQAKGGISLISRNKERAGKDASRIPGFDQLVQQLRDGDYPSLASYAESRGQGDLEAGLFDIVQGGKKALESQLVGPESQVFDVLEEYRERLERSPTQEGGEPDEQVSEAGFDDQPSNVERTGGDAGAGTATPATREADDFQLTGEGSTDATPIVEPYQPERIPPKRKSERQPQLEGLPEDLDESVLAGQQGLFGTNAELKGSAQNASLPALKPKTKNQPKTAAGKKLFDKLRADEGKNRVGLRSINDYLVDLAQTRLFIGNTQTSKRNPAHYLGRVNSKGRPTGYGPHIIRSRTGYSHVNVHEVGHAISGYLGNLDPRWHKSVAGDLVKLTRMKGSVASANTPEEGWAELVRRYVVLPNSVPKNLYAEFEKTMGKYNPEMLSGLQDAQAAYAYHRSRPVMDQLQTLMYDKGREKGIVGVIKDQLYRMMFSTIGGDVVLHRIYRRGWRGIGGDNAATGYDPTGLVSKGRSLIDEAYRERQKLADGFYKQIKDTPADMESAYQSWLHVPEESGRAIIGDKNGREGIRIRATGQGLDMLDEKSIEKLRDAGFYIPDAKARHGDWIYLNDKSFDSIKSAVGKDNWQAFETWGQMRAALDRYKKAGHDYPLRGDGLTPELLEQFVNEHQAANPDWDKHFRDVNKFMDQLLLVPVLGGEISVSEAIRITDKWSDYWPLPRQIEGKGVKSGGGGAEPSAGIRSAYGSLLPFRSLTEAVESRVKSAMEAYYTNRMMLSVKNYGDMLDSFNKNMIDPEATGKEDKNPLASFGARKEAMQLMLPLKLEMKVAAKLSVREQQEIVAKAMNEMTAEEIGVSVSELEEESVTRPEDVVISTPGKAVWRSTKPRAAHVVRVFENGSPKYYQVPDPLLFDFFAHGQKSPNAYFRTAGILLRGLAAPWKRAITQSIPFALNNAIARDPFTAASLSKAETKKSLLPGYFMGVGVVNRVTGGNLDAVSQSELLSRSLDQTSSKPHLTRWENFKEMLAEGIVPPNYSDMPWYDKAASLPGQAMSTILKPADVFNYITAGRALSKLGEEATREGAYITALREGASDERAQLAYDQITGNFGQRGGNPEVAELVRSAGFLNPALQILWGSAQHPTHYNPAMRTRYIVAKMPAIASLSAVAAAVNVLLIKAMHDEDDAKEIFAQMQERKDEDRLSKMAVGGMVALPFDYGHVGAVQSYAWNAVEGWMLDDPVDPGVRAKELLHRATTLPGVADTIPPHVKLWIELGAGETGHSFFYNDDIVPAWLVDKYKNNPELRAYPETPTAYKKIGEWLGVSPMKVRYAVTSGLSREMDAALTTAERPNKDVSDIVVAGRMATKESTGFNSDSVQSLMELDYEYTQLKERAENETDPATKAELEAKVASMETTHAGATLVDKVWQAAKEMRENGDTAGYKKAKRIMVGMGRDILGAPPLKGFPDPWRDWSDMPPEIQESIAKYVTLRAEESLAGRGLPDKIEDEADDKYKARVQAWKDKRVRSTDWLTAHKDSPAVQSVVTQVAKDIPPYPEFKPNSSGVDVNYNRQVAEWQLRYGKSKQLVESLK